MATGHQVSVSLFQVQTTCQMDSGEVEAAVVLQQADGHSGLATCQ